MTLILGIETSCDETAAAVVADGQTIRSNVVESQVEIHQRYGGVFPEVASRQHVLSILPVIGQAMAEAEADWDILDAVAVTHGPGLAGSLLVGVNFAKGIAWGRDLAIVLGAGLEEPAPGCRAAPACGRCRASTGCRRRPAAAEQAQQVDSRARRLRPAARETRAPIRTN